MAFGSAISEHPITAIATGEVTGSVLEAVGMRPGVAIVFTTAAHAGAFEDVVSTINEILKPEVLIGAVCASVVGPGREVEKGAGISLWASSATPVRGVRLDVGEDQSISGWPDFASLPFEASGFVLLADPFTFPAEDFLERLDKEHPGLPVVGGMASAAQMAGGNRMVFGTDLVSNGAIGFLLGPGVTMEPVVSQGCRPFGRPLVVTRSEQNIIYELAGKPAIERLVAAASSDLDEEEIELLSEGGLQIGRVMDEHLESFSTGDFLIRNILGTDRRSGALAVGDLIPIGVTVQFHLRDAQKADEDLNDHLMGHSADAALLFTCTGRGSRLFGGPDHDAEAIVDHLGPIPTAGFFAAGEIGPVGGRNFLHGFTASMALLRERNGSSREVHGNRERDYSEPIEE